MKHINVCYYCGTRVTNREHIPPLCLFPETKDTFGLDFRKDLITVPSCYKHNLKKSTDDEFLLISIAGIVGNNLVGLHHNFTKVNRALRRKSIEFLESTIMNNPQLIDHEIGGRKFPVIIGNPDFTRLIRCFSQIARGLYFYEFNQVFKGKMRTLLGFIKYKEGDMNTYIRFIRDRVAHDHSDEDCKGSNPQIFKYFFLPPDKDGIIALKMIFYGETDVYVAFLPKMAKIPFDLGNYLRVKGIPTVYTLGEKTYEFNMKDSQINFDPETKGKSNINKFKNKF